MTRHFVAELGAMPALLPSARPAAPWRYLVPLSRQPAPRTVMHAWTTHAWRVGAEVRNETLARGR